MALELPLLPPEEAIAYLEDKGYAISFDWRDVLAEEHAAAFTVAKMMRVDLLEFTKQALIKAEQQGWDLKRFSQELRPTLEREGWWGRKEMVDPDTAEIKTVQLGSPRRLEIIFDTNIRTANSAGEWMRGERSAKRLPMLLYRTMGDMRVRPQHARWNGVCLPRTDPWWNTHYPPNGWRSLLPWEGVRGQVMLGLKARYSGPAVEIVGDSGHRLCLTAYHPVLTDGGWLPADKIMEGMNLLRYVGVPDGGTITPGSNDDDPPTLAEQVFKSLRKHGMCPVPRAAFNLYGDERFIESDIEVVCANRELLDRVESERDKFIEDFALEFPDMAFPGAARDGGFFLDGPNPAGRDLLSKLTGAAHAVAESSFALSLDHHGASIIFNPEAFQVRRNQFRAQMGLRRKLLDGRPGSVQPLQIVGDGLTDTMDMRRLPGSFRDLDGDYLLVGAKRNASVFETPVECGVGNPQAHGYLLKAQAGLIHLDRVREVKFFHYEGAIYDFQTRNSLIISLGGYCVSNCRCVAYPISEADVRRLKDSGRIDLKPTAPPTQTVQWVNPRTGEIRQVPAGIDPGWDYNVGKARQAHLDKLLAEKTYALNSRPQPFPASPDG